MTHSILRKLARDYHEGRLDRVSYQQRRRQVIDDWVRAGGELSRAEARTTPEHTFSGAGDLQPDARDLASALANRDKPAAGRLVPSEPAIPLVSGVPESNRPAAGGGRDDRLSGLGSAPPERADTEVHRRRAPGFGPLGWSVMAALAAVLVLVGYLLWR